MAHWIIEDHGFGGAWYKCSSCGKSWYDLLEKVPRGDNCQSCGEPINEDENEYIEDKPKRRSNTMTFPYTIGKITFYTAEELREWVIAQQDKMNAEVPHVQ